MKKRSDEQLLRAWSRDRCERSFRALTERYADLVFGTAARRLADRNLAEEVSQNVFITLAKKAGQLKGENGIGGWLFKATVLEAAGIRRSESRRDKRMRELTDLDETLRSVGGESMAGDALEIVDDGLAGLNADDRDALIARYFNGASYEEMAQGAGRSESACRKQVSRALRKLAKVLEGRGVRVSTTVLAAGLGALMSTKAPAGLAGTCAGGAITAAGGAVAPGISATIVTAMTTSKMTGVLVIGGVLLLVSTGAGYVAGRTEAKNEAHRSGAAWPDSSGPTRSQRVDSLRPLLGRGGAVESKVEATITRLKNELRGTSWGMAVEVGVPIVEGLISSEMEEALALCDRSGDEKLRKMMSLVLNVHWGKIDGLAATDHMLNLEDRAERHPALHQVLASWAEIDPRSALAWQNSLLKKKDLPVDEFAAGSLEGAILGVWAKSEMDSAWDWYEAMTPDRQKMALHALEDLVEEPEHREALALRIAGIGDEKLRSRVAEEIGGAWAQIEPAAAAAWLESVEFQDPMLRLRVAMEIGEEWFDTDPEKAAGWLWPMLPEAMHLEFIQELAETPVWKNEEARAAWLAERGYNLDGTKR